MQKVLLLISKIRLDSTYLQVKCSISPSDRIDEVAMDRIFSHPDELEEALRAAGVSDGDAGAPFHVFNNSLPTFIPVSAEVARKLGVLV